MFAILRSTITSFVTHRCTQMAAAIAYYMVFSLPGLLLISVTLAGYVAKSGALGDEGVVRKEIFAAVEQATGPISAKQVDELIQDTRRARLSPLHAVAGTLLLLVSASAVMVQVQTSLNTILHVDAETDVKRDRGFVKNRLITFLAVGAIGLILLLSVILSMALATVGDMLMRFLPQLPSLPTSKLLSVATDLAVSFLLFTAVYRWLPDVRVSWHFALLGGTITALTFIVGKTVLAYYLTQVHIGSAYGVAGSLVMLLAWFYYNAIMFLLGAEFTYALRAGTR